MVNQLATQLLNQQKVKQAGGTIHQYRQHQENLAQAELKQALLALERGQQPEQVLQAFSHRLTQKMSHVPSLLLRQAAQSDDPTLFEWLEENVHEILTQQRPIKKRS